MHYGKYRIAGKFGEDFNLAVWRIVKNRQIKFSPNKIRTRFLSVREGYRTREQSCKALSLWRLEACHTVLHEGVVEGRIKHEAKPSALLTSRPRPRAIFPVVHERKRCFNWFSVILIRSDSNQTIVLTFEF